MTIVPIQPFGLGDHIFTQSLVRQIAGDGDILYPVLPQFVEGLSRAYPNVKFMDWRSVSVNFEVRHEQLIGEYRTLPIRFADQLLNTPYHNCMRAKYGLYGLDWNTWRDVMFVRDNRKEDVVDWEMANAYAYNIPNGEYNLISKHYGSGSQFEAKISVNNGLPNVFMETLADDLSLFDWAKVIENATTIHAVSSSIVYLLELLDLKATEMHLYGRHHEPKTWYKNIEYILTKKYEIHG